jgi:hypothetical protein
MDARPLSTTSRVNPSASIRATTPTHLTRLESHPYAISQSKRFRITSLRNNPRGEGPTSALLVTLPLRDDRSEGSLPHYFVASSLRRRAHRDRTPQPTLKPPSLTSLPSALTQVQIPKNLKPSRINTYAKPKGVPCQRAATRTVAPSSGSARIGRRASAERPRDN